MKIKKKITEEIVTGFICDMCHKASNVTLYNRGILCLTQEYGCDAFHRHQVDLCIPCTQEVFEFIESKGGKIRRDYYT